MFQKLVDLLKEVFWIKPSVKKSISRKKTVKRTVKKKSILAKVKPKPVVKSVKPTKTKAKIKPEVKIKPVKQPKAALKTIDPALQEIGVITHYFDRIKVCVVNITQGTLLIGDKLTILGDKTKFVQKVWSMQIESEDVKVAKKGQIIGIKVDKAVTVGDKVYKS